MDLDFIIQYGVISILACFSARGIHKYINGGYKMKHGWGYLTPVILSLIWAIKSF